MKPIIAAAILLVLTGFGSPIRAEEPAVIGQPAPVLQAKELDGTSFDLAAMRGKVVIVHFWATWCPSCHEEMEVLDHFYQKYHERGVEIIGITLDKPRKLDEVRVTMQSYGFPTAMLADTAKNGFGEPATIPVTYIIDKGGVLRAWLSPETQILNPKILEDTVGPLLGRQ